MRVFSKDLLHMIYSRILHITTLLTIRTPPSGPNVFSGKHLGGSPPGNSSVIHLITTICIFKMRSIFPGTPISGVFSLRMWRNSPMTAICWVFLWVLRTSAFVVWISTITVNSFSVESRIFTVMCSIVFKRLVQSTLVKWLMNIGYKGKHSNSKKKLLQNVASSVIFINFRIYFARRIQMVQQVAYHCCGPLYLID